MPTILDQSSRAYRALIHRLAGASPGYRSLNNFVNVKKDTCDSPPKFTLVTIRPDVPSEAQDGLSFRDFSGTAKLAEEIISSQLRKRNCNIFIVENVCPQTIALLGGHFDINPQFFADHVRNGDWFKDNDLIDQLPALPSSQKFHEFLQIRFIQTIAVSLAASPHFSGVSASACRPDLNDPARDYMIPDEHTSRLPRMAGKLIPRVRNDVQSELLLCTKQNITVWFQKGGHQDEGWNCIILIDPPFKLPPGNSYCQPPQYRSFMRRPTLANPSIKDMGPHSSNREAIVCHLKEQFNTNSLLRSTAQSDCFFVLGNLYQLAASNWIVINEYINRELTTIEYTLEREEPSFRDLEIYLKDLYIHRRRVTRYHELITETKDQCTRCGQRSWPRNLTSSVAAEQALDREDDFSNLQLWIQWTAQRIEKNIKLLTALVAIGEGKQGLAENHGIARLSLLAMVFLPFSSVATILGMQGNFAPGDGKFWLFWVVAVSLTAFVVGAFLCYDGVMGWIRERLRIRWLGKQSRADEEKSLHRQGQ